jgi:glucokinase
MVSLATATKTNSTTMYLLTGDIGGTNSRMALYDVSSPVAPPLVERTFRNFEHIPSDRYCDPNVFASCIIVPFLEYCWEQQTAVTLEPLSRVCILATLATAGLVHQNRGNLTNLGNMLIDGNAIAENTLNKYLNCIAVCRIINDFVAVRWTYDMLVSFSSNESNSKFIVVCAARIRMSYVTKA